MTFTPITPEHIPLLRKYYAGCDYGICEYSAGVKLMWRHVFNSEFTEMHGCLIIKNKVDGEISFDLPVAGEGGDFSAAMDEIDIYCTEKGICPVFGPVPKEKIGELVLRYPYASYGNIRNWQDYIYYAGDLRDFVGKKYAGQRNHIKKFPAACPNAVFTVLTDNNSPMIERFWEEYSAEFSKADSESAKKELKISRELMPKLVGEGFFLGGFVDNGRLLSLSLGEKCGETIIVHIEKALYSCPGVYPATVQAFARQFAGGVRYLNREDDAADKGLRTSKLQYGPDHMGYKYWFETKNELMVHIEEIPEIKTDRLTLSAICEEDIPDYNKIVLDTYRNRFWGYDDIAGVGDEASESRFFDVAKRDFDNRLCVNFAVRLDGKMIGEAVLYSFNCRGDAELGCRIDRDYAGFGYGTEAFAAVCHWALYKLSLNRVVAKCYLENEPSYKMLSNCMRQIGRDEKFFYFEKRV